MSFSQGILITEQRMNLHGDWKITFAELQVTFYRDN